MENYIDVFNEIMLAWDDLELEASILYPELDDDELYQVCASALNRSIEG